MAEALMETAHPRSPNSSFFNDLTQQNYGGGDAPEGSEWAGASGDLAEAPADNENGTKTKRIACVLCRKRKLRCDGARPACGTCKRLAHDCAYDEVRRKSGPKRGYVKALEARLHQVETLLKTQETSEPCREGQEKTGRRLHAPTMPRVPVEPIRHPDTSISAAQSSNGLSSNELFGDMGSNTPLDNQATEAPFPWEMIGLGLDEPLPTQDVVDELHQIYFEKVDPSLSMVHRRRYLAAMNLAPHMRPPVCLRYIIWCLAASVTDKYDALKEHFYQRARKYAQMDEMKGHGESMATVAHCQAWVLIMVYEFKNMYFPRAWLSAGRATRLAQMMGLHRLDGMGLDVKQCIPPPKDWTEREERRRTFWQTFIGDRSASIGTGWPMTIDERDILTNLPAPDDAFDKSRPVPTITLQDALSPTGAGNLSSMGGIILMAYMFGQNLLHLHRPTSEDCDNDLHGEFWKRHRRLDAILSSTSLSLPDQLRLPRGLSDPNAVYLNMCLHTSVICLHQAAIFKADRNKLPPNVGAESKIRCVTAAAEITSVMRMISHMDLTSMNCFIPFCLYVASRVFIQYLKSRAKDEQMKSSLLFLLAAMHALKRKNPLTESFLAQLEVDLDGSGIIDTVRKTDYYSTTGICEIPRNTDHVGCSPIFELRESQSGPSPGPGPPFHVSHIQAVDMNVEPTPFGYTPGANSDSTLDLPSRTKASGVGNRVPPTVFSAPGIETATPDSEMDTTSDQVREVRSPSTAPTSHHASSHASYSPQSQHQGDGGGASMLHHQQRGTPTFSNGMQPAASRHGSTGSNAHGLLHSTAGPVEPPFYPVTGDDDFQNQIAGDFYTPSCDMHGDNVFGLDGHGAVASGGARGRDGGEVADGTAWDMTGAEGSGVGLPPMSDGSWTQMLDNLSAWDAIAQPHQFDLDDRGVN